jgi:polyhydroxyalkanoate synthesis regulator phasin
MAAMITAIVYVATQKFSDLSEAAQKSFSSFTDTIHSSTSAFLEEIRAKGGMSEEELQKKIQEIREAGEKERQELKEEAARRIQKNSEETNRKIQENRERTNRKIQADREEALDFDLRYEARKAADKLEAEEAGRRAYEEFTYRYFGSTDDPQNFIEQNCAKINHDGFRNMPDLDRLTDLRLNPNCCDHAKVMFMHPSDSAPFSLADKVSSQWKDLAKKIHPDKNPGLFEIANQAMSRLNQAHGTLSSTKCWQQINGRA